MPVIRPSWLTDELYCLYNDNVIMKTPAGNASAEIPEKEMHTFELLGPGPDIFGVAKDNRTQLWKLTSGVGNVWEIYNAGNIEIFDITNLGGEIIAVREKNNAGNIFKRMDDSIPAESPAYLHTSILG